MKNFFVLSIILLVSSNPVFAESIPTKSEILKKSNDCIKDYQFQVCKKLIMQLETLQILAYVENRFKCQSSILGLQTELIRSNFFENVPRSNNRIMITYVINNC